MKILGLSSNYHDASAALIVDGKVVCSSAEERFTYEKHDPSFPVHSIAFCLNYAGITGDDLDLVVYHEDPITKFTRTLASSFKRFPFSMTSFLKTARDMITTGFWIRNEISSELQVSVDKVICLPHHMSHAAHAFLSSTFDEAAVVTIDAVGEWSTSCIFHGKKTEGGYTLEPVDLVPFPHSLGLVYSAFTAFLGFKANDGECSTMALAAFGRPIFADEVRKIIELRNDGTFAIDSTYFDFSSDEKLPLTEKFVRIFGAPRAASEKLMFSSLSENRSHDEKQIRYANVAASVQLVLEESVIGYMQRASRITGSKNLCYAGGVALNCVANSKVVEANIFERVYVPPDPGDGGGAMGAALYASMLWDRANSPSAEISPYLGKDLGDEAGVVAMIREFDPGLEIKQFESEEAMLKFTAGQIADHKIVGWVQGRFENGPRALGNRSILCRPDSVETAERLSRDVKHRASFRPYASSVLAEKASEYLEIGTDVQLGSWMQSSFRLTSKGWQSLRAGAHIDRSTRGQIVRAEENPLYSKLLEACDVAYGIPAVLNTSFNMSGLPIVSNQYDAFAMFVRTKLDVLVFNRVAVLRGKP